MIKYLFLSLCKGVGLLIKVGEGGLVFHPDNGECLGYVQKYQWRWKNGN